MVKNVGKGVGRRRKRKNKNQTEDPIVTVPNHGASMVGLWLSMFLAFRKRKPHRLGAREEEFKQSKGH